MGLMLSYKKYKDRYFDWDNNEEFQSQDINNHNRWYINKYNNNGEMIRREYYDGSWEEYDHDKSGKLKEYRTNKGFWQRWEHDNDGNFLNYTCSTD